MNMCVAIVASSLDNIVALAFNQPLVLSIMTLEIVPHEEITFLECSSISLAIAKIWECWNHDG